VRSFRWDGTDDDGKTMPDGTYTFSVQAIDGTGSAVTATTSVTGTVVGVNFKDGLTRLILNNGNEVSLSNVTEIYQQGGA
jgi:flagellar basal-body rod modification protein FlgD